MEKLYIVNVLLSSISSALFNVGWRIWLPGCLDAINENSNSQILTIAHGDFLVHHVIALGLHTTTLILVKGIGIPYGETWERWIA